MILIIVFFFFYTLDPTKYFGFELGAQTNIDEKNDKYILNGKHDQETLATVRVISIPIAVINI